MILDHSAIFLLIAGTYTGFTLSALEGTWSWTLFALIWCLAFCGVLMKSLGRGTSNLHVALYLAMGWLAVVAVKPLWSGMPAWELFWILAGGMMYSAGVIFFVIDQKLRYSHFVWHLFALAGTGCHVVAVLGFAY